MHANKGCLQTFAPDPDASMFRCKESLLSVIDRELWEAFKPLCYRLEAAAHSWTNHGSCYIR
jgi:hypothetical protein